jgi:hypothetical protein
VVDILPLAVVDMDVDTEEATAAVEVVVDAGFD